MTRECLPAGSHSTSGRVGETVPGGREDLNRWWGRIEPVWHLLYAGLLALVTLTTWLTGSLDTAQRWTAMVLLTAMAALYALVGRQLFRVPGGTRGVGYIGLTWLCFYGLVYVTGQGTTTYFLLFALFPQIWAFLPRRRAVVSSVLLVAGLAVVQVATAGWGWDAVMVYAPLAAMQAGLLLLLGLLIHGLASQADRRAELIDELNATRAELAETEHARGVLAERERLAREIHDTLAQGFTSVLTLAQALEASMGRDAAPAQREQLTLLERTARDSLTEARTLIDALAPADLRDSGLPAAIGRVTSRFSEDTGIPVEVDIAGSERPLPAFVEIVLLRATQEALANVRKHARASRVWTALSVNTADSGAPEAAVTVTDNGIGFDVGAAEGFGLRSMRARARQAGGDLEIMSAPGQGTTVRVHVPLSGAAGGVT